MIPELGAATLLAALVVAAAGAVFGVRASRGDGARDGSRARGARRWPSSSS